MADPDDHTKILVGILRSDAWAPTKLECLDAANLIEQLQARCEELQQDCEDIRDRRETVLRVLAMIPKEKVADSIYEAIQQVLSGGPKP